MSEQVQNIVHFKNQYRKIVRELVQIRKEANLTQSDLAGWLGVDRRKIIAFEGLEKIDTETLLNYSDKLSVKIELKHEIQ